MSEDLIKSSFTYDPDTGVLFWATRAASKIKVGDKAGTLSKKGYLTVKLLGKMYLVHRIIWLLCYGSWPEDQIDHVNGLRADNRIKNLRAVSNQENQRNRRLSCKNKTGVSGVILLKSGRYRAVIRVCGVLKHLGQFTTLEEAAGAKAEAESFYGFHPNHGKR